MLRNQAFEAKRFENELASELGVDPGTLSRWELGIRMPRGRFADQVDGILNRAGSVSRSRLDRGSPQSEA